MVLGGPLFEHFATATMGEQNKMTEYVADIGF
jgi:hypothetical protein